MALNPRAVFLDAGMTLLRPTEPVTSVYHRVAGELGISLERTTFEAHMDGMWRKVSAARRPAESDEEHRSSDAIERGFWDRFTTAVAAPFPALAAQQRAWLDALVRHFDGAAAWQLAAGAGRLIDDARRRGCRVGVVSNWHAALNDILDGLGIRPRLDFVLVSADFGWRKPHRAIFERALELAETPPEGAVHVGDSPHDDVGGALGAGIRPVLMHEDPAAAPAGTDRTRDFAELGRLLFG